MAKRKKGHESAINAEGWMMSYADMITLLLALFIMLSTLGKDQTGMRLQKGLESYREHVSWFGLSGLFGGADKGMQDDSPMPKYPYEAEGAEGRGDPRRVMDVEKEKLQHFLGEMSRQFKTEALPRIANQATLDVFEPLAAQAPYLTAKHVEALQPLLPVLRREDHRLLVIVWTTMPSDAPWQKAAQQSQVIGDQVANLTRLDPAARMRLMCVAQTWPHSNHERPALSLVVARVEAPVANHPPR
jgi:flagellar motor protein MotB